jgi:hypothetical protein
MPPHLGAVSPCDSTPGAHPGSIPLVSPKWEGADAERRRRKLIGSGAGLGAQRAERVGPRSGSPLLNLDPSHIRVPSTPQLGEIDRAAPQWSQGEWCVRQKTIDGYTQIFAIDDPDHDFARRGSGATSDKGNVSTIAKKRRAVERLAAPPDEFEIAQRRKKAVHRSRTGLMWAVRGMRGDRIFTLTKRGRIQSKGEAWALWRKFLRIATMRFKGFQTIVVIEPHTEDGFHIHFVANRFWDVSIMRFWWHRVLTGERLRSVLRGEDSPGNVEAGRPHRGEKIAKYLGKYVGKAFQEIVGRAKRYACSKGIRKPIVTPSRMPRSMGAEVFHLRSILESQGFRNFRMFETGVMGRRFIWMEGLKRDVPRGT